MDAGIPISTEVRAIDRPGALQIALLVGVFAAATAVGAQVRIPLPYTPVPITLQTFVVLLAGTVLGAGWGAVSIGLYLVAGAVGAPVFAGGGAGMTHLTGATSGYLLALPAAAYLAGWLPGESPRRIRLYLSLLLSGLFVLSVGTLWLGLLFGRGLGSAAALGFWPFLAGDLVKTAAAAELGLRLGRRA